MYAFVVGYGSPVCVAGYLRHRQRFYVLRTELRAARLNLSFSSSWYLCEMNSTDERIWRTVIVSVGAAGISRESRELLDVEVAESGFKASLFVLLLDIDAATNRYCTFKINWLFQISFPTVRDVTYFFDCISVRCTLVYVYVLCKIPQVTIIFLTIVNAFPNNFKLHRLILNLLLSAFIVRTALP